MKKNQRTIKLSLNCETLATLMSDQLGGVVGGAFPPSFNTCPTLGPRCEFPPRSSECPH